MSNVRKTIEARGGAHRYVVTINVSDGRSETINVPADSETMAETRAMALTTLRLAGETVKFDTAPEA